MKLITKLLGNKQKSIELEKCKQVNMEYHEANKDWSERYLRLEKEYTKLYELLDQKCMIKELTAKTEQLGAEKAQLMDKIHELEQINISMQEIITHNDNLNNISDLRAVTDSEELDNESDNDDEDFDYSKPTEIITSNHIEQLKNISQPIKECSIQQEDDPDDIQKITPIPAKPDEQKTKISQTNDVIFELSNDQKTIIKYLKTHPSNNKKEIERGTKIPYLKVLKLTKELANNGFIDKDGMGNLIVLNNKAAAQD